ncbi:transmembrane protein 87A-like [Uloborus diversus]|uniref:transmembrane protein 87A-like n=1 Tax=Uloborus diversus TaxID=327109 RepID=UPI002409046A|nr:transmembrane protein 87A-like [Uloborus diversus]
MRLTLFLTLVLVCRVHTFPDPGQWSTSYSNVPSVLLGIPKPLYADSSIYMSVNCDSEVVHKIEIQWVIRQTSCFEDYIDSDIANQKILLQYFTCPMTTNYFPKIRFFGSKAVVVDCSNRINLEYTNASFITVTEKYQVPFECQSASAFSSEVSADRFKIGNGSNANGTHFLQRRSPVNVTKEVLEGKDNVKNLLTTQLSKEKFETPHNSAKQQTPVNASQVSTSKKELSNKEKNELGSTVNSSKSHKDYHQDQAPIKYYASPSSNNLQLGSKLTTVDMDGVYLFILQIKPLNSIPAKFNVSVDIAMKGNHGYLSAIDYPLLIFYGIMCVIYVMYAIAWLAMSALQWRDLLRIQFWIGAVILLGLVEKAVFYAEYQSINYTGRSVQGAILFAEILSCMKRTLARMLIIIVSLGFGIVKPRLGSTLHRIIGVGAIYFCLGTIEGCLRVLKPKTDPGNQALMAGIPLAVTDSAICWWISFILVQTIRTLRLRRNIVKLQLYRHFTNTLLLSVVGSIAFMTWSIHAHRLVNCITDWKELWVDEAYWHLLFSIILFAIIILWRPTNNNQRYAFTPLLDAIDDDDEDDDENSMTNDAFVGMKMRTSKSNFNASPKQDEVKQKTDEDLKWVEENIPTSLTDVALPSLLDSDEEIMTAKFERSKME